MEPTLKPGDDTQPYKPKTKNNTCSDVARRRTMIDLPPKSVF